MADTDIAVRNALLLEAQELLAAVLLALWMKEEILPLSPIGERVKDFNATLRRLGIVQPATLEEAR